LYTAKYFHEVFEVFNPLKLISHKKTEQQIFWCNPKIFRENKIQRIFSGFFCHLLVLKLDNGGYKKYVYYLLVTDLKQMLFRQVWGIWNVFGSFCLYSFKFHQCCQMQILQKRQFVRLYLSNWPFYCKKNFTLWKLLSNFSITQILREITFGEFILEAKSSIFIFRVSEFRFLWIFALSEGWNLPNQQNQVPLEWQKMAVLEFPHSPKLVSRKIWVKEKSWNFTLCFYCSGKIAKWSILHITCQHWSFSKLYDQIWGTNLRIFWN